VLAGAVSGARILPTSKARAQGAAANPLQEVRALFFDVFGTERFAAWSTSRVLRKRADHMMTAYRAMLATVVTFVAASVPIHAGAQTGLGFKTPSNNIFCIIEDPYDNHPVSGLRCDLQQQNSMPPRPRDCPLSWGDAFSIDQTDILACGYAMAIRQSTTSLWCCRTVRNGKIVDFLVGHNPTA
jgi:hypothetical protein